MSFVCDRVGLENILSGFDLYQCPCFSIWQSKDMKFAYISDSIDDARDMFEQNLNGIHDNSTALYKIKFYKEPSAKSGEIDRNTPEVGSFTFRMNNGEIARQQLNTNGSQDTAVIVELMKQQNEAFLAALKMMNEKIDTIGSIEMPDDNAIDDTLIGQIGTALERYPALNDLAQKGFNFLENVANKLMGEKTYSEHEPARQIAGVNIPKEMKGNQKITAVISEIIKAHSPEQSEERLELLAEALRLLVERDDDFLNSIVGLSKLPAMKYNMAKSFL